MKQSKISLADVLTMVTAMAFGFVCFLGMNFLTLGNIYKSIKWGVFISITLAGTAYGAKLLKVTNHNFKTYFVMEVISLILFTSLTVYYSFSYFPHYYCVSDRKAEIQNDIKANIEQAIRMFPKYESYVETRIRNFRGYLETVSRDSIVRPALYKSIFKSGISDSIQINYKVSNLNKDLMYSEYSDTVTNNGIKEKALAWLQNAESMTPDWKPVSIIDVVNKIEQYTIKWNGELYILSQKVHPDEPNNSNLYNYPLAPLKSVKDKFTTRQAPTLLSIGLSIIAYGLMLLSYLVATRSSKSPIGTSRLNGEYDIKY